VEAFDPLRIVVFGSYARGEARPGSDLDLLVVLPDVENKREAAIAMRRVLPGLQVAKDVVVTTPDEAARRRDSTWHIVGSALREGKTVYRKDEGTMNQALEDAQRWLRYAQEDLRTAETLVGDPESVPRHPGWRSRLPRKR